MKAVDDKSLKINVEDLLKCMSSTHMGSFSSGSNTEAEEVKKSWYNYVLVVIEEFDKKINKLYSDQLNNKTQALKDSIILKDNLRQEIVVLSKELKNALFQQEQKLNEYMKEIIQTRIDIMSSDLKQLLTEEITNLNLSCRKDILKCKEENTKALEPVKTLLTEVRIKVSLWGAAAGFAASLIVLLLSYVWGLPKPLIP